MQGETSEGGTSLANDPQVVVVGGGGGDIEEEGRGERGEGRGGDGGGEVEEEGEEVGRGEELGEDVGPVDAEVGDILSFESSVLKDEGDDFLT